MVSKVVVLVNKKLVSRSVIYIFIILSQIIMFGATAYYYYFMGHKKPMLGNLSWETTTWILVIIGVFLSFFTIHMVKAIIYLAEQETEAELVSSKLTNSLELVDALRSQRHDNINHLQVIYGLIQLGKTTEAEQYIIQVRKDIE